jgi:hypothetical protein
MDHQASPEDFELEETYKPLTGRTLEEVIIDGESEWEKQQTKDYVTLNSEPQWLLSVLINLKRRHQNIPNVSAIERLVAKLGIATIREEYSERIKEIERLRKRIFESGDQVFLMKSYKASAYQLQETVATTYRKCSIREWVAGAISDSLVDPLGLSSSMATLLVLVAGISKSTSWVPKRWVTLAIKEMENFGEYLENEVKRLQRIITELSL